MKMLRCTKCGEPKPVHEDVNKSGFYMRHDRKVPRPLQPCKDCKGIYLKQWYTDSGYRRRPSVPLGHKFCPACKGVLPTEDFAPDAGRKDGRQVYCRKCWPSYMQKWRQEPSTMDLQRAKNRRVRRTPVGASKQRARQLTNLAIKFGYLVPKPCEVEGCTEPVQAHHTQYDKPLDGIRWLCEEHHKTHGHNGDFTNPPV